MFVTLVIIIILTPFCQIIEIFLYSHVYRDTRAYILDPCIREFYLGSRIQEFLLIKLI